MWIRSSRYSVGNDHQGWTTAQKIAAKVKPRASSETGSRRVTALSASRM